MRKSLLYTCVRPPSSPAPLVDFAISRFVVWLRPVPIGNGCKWKFLGVATSRAMAFTTSIWFKELFMNFAAHSKSGVVLCVSMIRTLSHNCHFSYRIPLPECCVGLAICGRPCIVNVQLWTWSLRVHLCKVVFENNSLGVVCATFAHKHYDW